MSAAKILGDKNLGGHRISSKGLTSAEKENADGGVRKSLLMKARSLSTTRDDSSFTIYEEKSDYTEEQPKGSKTPEKQALSPKENAQTHIDFVTSDEPSAQYWKILAETRRKALSEALEENETLHSQVEEKDKEIRDLKAKLLASEKSMAEMEEIIEGYKEMSEMLEQLKDQEEEIEDNEQPEESD